MVSDLKTDSGFQIASRSCRLGGSNRLLVADTQQQVAASRRLLRAGQRQR
jgi:hypothetical protein